MTVKANFSEVPNILQAIKKYEINRKDFTLTTCQSGVGNFEIFVGIYAKDKCVLDELLRFIEGLHGVTRVEVHIWLVDTLNLNVGEPFERRE